MKSKTFFILILILFPLMIWASADIKKENTRRVNFYGQVKDGFTGADLPAKITLMKGDSTVVDTMTAKFATKYDAAGYFFANKPVEKGRYIMKAEIDGYDLAYVEKNIRFIGRNVGFEFPIITMHRRIDSYTHELGEVKVTGTMVKLVHKGDTLVYNARAFKVPDGSMLDALVRQLPGAELRSNGDILINGRKIDNLTLNGDDFFRGSNSVMLNNLPYFTVNQIKVYNKQTERSRKVGHDVEPREYIMDVVLKRDYNRGYLASMMLGGGNRERYTGQTFLLGYGDLTRIALYGNMNNLNQNPKPGDKGEWTPDDMGDGVSSVKKVGVSITTKNKNESFKNELTSEFSQQQNHSLMDSYTQQYVDAGDVFSRAFDDMTTKNMRWNFSNKMELGKTLTWNLNTDYQRKNTDEMMRDSSYTLEERINMSAKSIWQRNHTFSISSGMNYSFKLPWGDIMEFNLNGKYGTQRFRDDTHRTTDYLNTGTKSLQYLTGNNPGQNYSFSGAMNYQISFLQNWALMPSISYNQSYNKKGSEFFSDETLHPSSYRSGVMTHSSGAGLALIYNHNGAEGFTVGRMQMNMTQQQDRLGITTPQDYNIYRRTSWLSSVNMDFAFQNSVNSLIVNYQLSSSAPQMGLMYGPVNTFDPLLTIYRNTDLHNIVTNNLNADYTHSLAWHGLDLTASASWTATHGMVGYMKAYDTTTGHFEYCPGNVNGNWNTDMGFSANMNIDKKGLFRLNGVSQLLYNHNVDFDISTSGLTDKLSKVNTFASKQMLKITYSKSDFQVGLQGTLYGRHITGTRSNFTSFNCYDNEVGLNFQMPLLVKFSLASDLTLFSRSGYQLSSMNQNNLVWNASLSHTFAKGSFTASMEAYDILHQLSNNRISVNAQARTEVHVNTIPSYIMLRLQYHFNILPKKH